MEEENQSQEIGDEKRKSRRFSVVDLDVYGKESGEHVGKIINLSHGGMLVTGEKSIEVNTIQQLTIPFQQDEDDFMYLSVEAKCVWSTKSVDYTSFSIGFEFLDNTDEQYKLIKNMVKEFSK
ncbi:MAG: PilZ domain-containing protein [Chloroflexi bacterium]|nr:PilZ domain-containing protein [Chloroflexota bacterium]